MSLFGSNLDPMMGFGGGNFGGLGGGLGGGFPTGMGGAFPSTMEPFFGSTNLLEPFAGPLLAGPLLGPSTALTAGTTDQQGQIAPAGTRGRTPIPMGAAGWTRSIPVDFIERQKEYVVRADIPGVHKGELHVEVHDGNVLRFGHNPHAEREKEDEEEPGTFHRAERVSSFRNRNLRMPQDADMTAQLKATYEDGVLQVIIPKKEMPEQVTNVRSVEVA